MQIYCGFVHSFVILFTIYVSFPEFLKKKEWCLSWQRFCPWCNNFSSENHPILRMLFFFFLVGLPFSNWNQNSSDAGILCLNGDESGPVGSLTIQLCPNIGACSFLLWRKKIYHAECRFKKLDCLNIKKSMLSLSVFSCFMGLWWLVQLFFMHFYPHG